MLLGNQIIHIFAQMFHVYVEAGTRVLITYRSLALAELEEVMDQVYGGNYFQRNTYCACLITYVPA